MRFFVSDKEMEDLERKAQNDRDVKSVEKRYRKQIDQLETRYEEKLEDLRDEKDKAIHKLQREVDKNDQTLDDAVADVEAEHKNEVENLKRDHKRALDTINDAKTQLEGKLKVVEARAASAADLAKREFAIADKETVLEAAKTANEAATKLLETREKALDKKIADFDKRVTDENEANYKRGYTDGTADSLREGIDAVAEAQESSHELAKIAVEKSLDRETVIVTTSTPAQTTKQNKQN